MEDEADELSERIEELEEQLESAENDPGYINPKWLEQQETLWDGFEEMA